MPINHQFNQSISCLLKLNAPHYQSIICDFFMYVKLNATNNKITLKNFY